MGTPDPFTKIGEPPRAPKSAAQATQDRVPKAPPVAVGANGTALLCPWTRDPIEFTVTKLGTIAKGPFWSTPLFDKRALDIVLTMRKGFPAFKKKSAAEPRLICPFTGDPVEIVSMHFPDEQSGFASGSGPVRYQARGPFWSTDWYQMEHHLLWDISQIDGIVPAFGRHFVVTGEVEAVDAPGKADNNDEVKAAIEEKAGQMAAQLIAESK